jgi:hypothetical protein
MMGRMHCLNCALKPGAINLRTAKKPPDGSDGFCANSLSPDWRGVELGGASTGGSSRVPSSVHALQKIPIHTCLIADLNAVISVARINSLFVFKQLSGFFDALPLQAK